MRKNRPPSKSPASTYLRKFVAVMGARDGIDLRFDRSRVGVESRRGPVAAAAARQNPSNRTSRARTACHGKIFPGLRMPCGSNAALTRFISAISSGDSSIGEERRLREADAVLAADRPFERDDAREQRALGLVRARDLVGVVRVDHDVDVDVAVAGMAEARDAQPEVARDVARRARTARGIRPFGTTTSWLNLSGAIIFSDSDSSRRTRHSSCRSASSRARRTSVAPAVAARVLDARGLLRDRLRRCRRLRAAAARRCPPARASAR